MTSKYIHFIAQPHIFGQNGSEKGAEMAPTLIKPMENHQTSLAESILLYGVFFLVRPKKSVSYDPHVASYDPHVASYDPHVASYDADVASFERHVTSYDPLIAAYDPHIASYDPHIASYDPHTTSM